MNWFVSRQFLSVRISIQKWCAANTLEWMEWPRTEKYLRYSNYTVLVSDYVLVLRASIRLNLFIQPLGAIPAGVVSGFL